MIKHCKLCKKKKKKIITIKISVQNKQITKHGKIKTCSDCYEKLGDFFALFFT